MAQLKPIKDRKGLIRYYSYIRSVKWTQAAYISLETTSKTTARVRHAMVEKVEYDIKRGMSFEFPWQKEEGGRTSIKLLSVRDCLDEWLEIKRTNTYPETFRTYSSSLRMFILTLKQEDNTPLRNINTQIIENFKKEQLEKGRSVCGINKDLRGVACFLKYALDKEYLKELPKIQKFKEPIRPPKYINEHAWSKLMSLDSLSDWWKDVFSLYRSCGARRSEPINGYLDGSFLIVPAELSKTKRELEIYLEDWQIAIVKKIHDARDKHLAKGSKMVTFKAKFSKTFKDALMEIGIYEKNVTKFHCLRDTFAVMRYLETHDLYLVCKELNHTTIKTTEKYAQFSLRRLEQDFTMLVKSEAIVKRVNNNRVNIRHTSINPHLLN